MAKKRVRHSIGQNYEHNGTESVQLEEPYELDKSRGFFLFDVIPMGKPRMTQRDRMYTNPNHKDPKKRQRKAVTEYLEFKNRIQACAQELNYQMGDTIDVLFLIPMPKSWSQKKRLQMEKMPHKQTPDVDNLTKALMDALNKDDSNVWKTNVEKRWAFNGSIIIFK